MKNKRIYVKVKDESKNKANLFEFPLLQLLNGDNIRLKIDNCEVTLFIENKGLSRENIDGFAHWGEIVDSSDWIKELCQRKKQTG